MFREILNWVHFLNCKTRPIKRIEAGTRAVQYFSGTPAPKADDDTLHCIGYVRAFQSKNGFLKLSCHPKSTHYLANFHGGSNLVSKYIATIPLYTKKGCVEQIPVISWESRQDWRFYGQ